MEDTITEPAPVETPVATPPVSNDPFALDENSLVSLSPEQRASVEPIIDSWRKKANEEIQKRESSVAEKYKPYEEKAQALDKLTKYQPFVQWWQDQQTQAASGASASQQQAIGNTKPQDVASQQEWQDAVIMASNGQPEKLQEIQARMMALWATPFVQQFTQKQQNLETKLELKELFETHPDAQELDSIGLDPKTKQGVSLLETCLEWAERNGKPMEDGYALAKKWADSMRVGAQQQAMGLVNSKKEAITAGPSTSTANQNIVEVDSAEELIKRSLDAQFTGDKNVRFVIRGKH